MSTRIDVTVSGLRSSSIPCVFRTVVLKSNEDIFSQMQQTDTKYVIKWNYNLEGNTLSLPVRCIVEFDGGQLSNGTIHWNNTKVLDLYKYEYLHNITETGDKILL